MAKQDDTGAGAPDQPNNPYYNHRMPPGYDLVTQLLPRMTGGPELANNVHEDPRLLEAVSSSAEGAIQCIHSSIIGIGQAQVVASNHTSELSDDTMFNLGWAVSFLAGLADGLIFVKDHVDYHLRQREAGDE